MTRLSQRLFRIMESQARIDDALRAAESRPAAAARIAQLRMMKLRAAALLRDALMRRRTVTA